jgi:hypothetical protein
VVQRVHPRRGGLAFCRGARGVGSLVDVFTVDVDGVGAEGRAPVSAAGIALFEAEELDLRLDSLHE